MLQHAKSAHFHVTWIAPRPRFFLITDFNKVLYGELVHVTQSICLQLANLLQTAEGFLKKRRICLPSVVSNCIMEIFMLYYFC